MQAHRRAKPAPRTTMAKDVCNNEGSLLFNGLRSSGVLAGPQNSVAFPKRGSNATNLVMAVLCVLPARSIPNGPEVGREPKLPRHVLKPSVILRDLRVESPTPTASGWTPSLLADVLELSFALNGFSSRGSLIASPDLAVVCVMAAGSLPCHSEVVCAPQCPPLRHSHAFPRVPGFVTRNVTSMLRRFPCRGHTSTAALYHTDVHHCHPIFWPPPESSF
jgi:hypothetical protein